MVESENIVDDSKLAIRAVKGDMGAFEELVKLYELPIFYLIRKKLNHEFDAKDITQQAFVKAYRNLDKFKIGANFKPWIFTIAMNLLRDHCRKQKKFTSVEEIENFATYETPDKELIKEENYQFIWEKAETILSELQYKVIKMYYKQSIKAKDIATKLNMSESNIKITLFRARKSLGSVLRDIR